jgi:hypothetical protein
MMGLSLDQDPGNALVERLRRLDGVRTANAIHLG